MPQSLATSDQDIDIELDEFAAAFCPPPDTLIENEPTPPEDAFEMLKAGAAACIPSDLKPTSKREFQNLDEGALSAVAILKHLVRYSPTPQADLKDILFKKTSREGAVVLQDAVSLSPASSEMFLLLLKGGLRGKTSDMSDDRVLRWISEWAFTEADLRAGKQKDEGDYLILEGKGNGP